MPPAAPKPPALPSPGAERSGEVATLEKLIAAAKGYRPLYHLLEAEMRAVYRPRDHAEGRLPLVARAAPSSPPSRCTRPSCGSDSTWATVPFDPLLQKAKLKGPGPAITHMAVLTDARQVNENCSPHQGGQRAGQRLKRRLGTTPTQKPESDPMLGNKSGRCGMLMFGPPLGR